MSDSLVCTLKVIRKPPRRGYGVLKRGLLGAVCGALSSCSALRGTASESQLNVDVRHSQKVYMNPELERSSQALHHYLMGQLSMKREDLKGAIANFQKASELDPKPAPTLHARLAELELRSGNVSNALEASSKAVAEEPSNLSFQLLHAGILEALDRDAEAERIYNRLIVEHPTVTDSYVLLAGLHSKQKEYQKALVALRKLTAAVPQDPVGHYYLGRTFEALEDLPAAERSMKQAYTRQPDNHGIAVELIRILLKREKVSDAKALCQRIIDQDPDNVVARKVLGQLLIGESRYEEALKHLQVLEKVEGDATETRFKIALIQIERRNFDEALRELNLVLARRPEFGQARYYLASVLASQGRVGEAADELMKISSDDEEFEKSRTFAAFLLKQSGEFLRAEHAVREALEVTTNRRPLVLYLFTILREAKRFEDARALVLSALDDDGENERLLYSLGVVLDDLNDPTGALAAMERVLVLNPKNADALNYVAYRLAETGGDLSRARDLIEQALTMKPNDGYFVDTLGWVYVQMGRYREAVEVLGRAVSLISDDPVILEHYAIALEKNGQVRKALEVYRNLRPLISSSDEHRELAARVKERIRALEGSRESTRP